MENELLKVSEVDLVYKSKNGYRPKISSSKDCYDVAKPFFQEHIEHHEEFWVFFLNRNNECIGAYCASKGGTAGCIVDPKIIFQSALKANTSGIIVAHNHPSGNLKPSQADFDITKKLKNGGKLLDIQVLDHIILTKDDHFSFANEGIL